MTKKLLSVAIALLLLLNVFSSSSLAAESDKHAFLKLDCLTTDPQRGDVLEIDVMLQADYVTNTFGASIVYDKNYYEPAEISESDNIVIADDIRDYGSKTVIMSDKRSSSVAQLLYDDSYTQQMKARYSVAWFSFLFRPSKFDDPQNDLIPSFETMRKVATLKLRVRSDAPVDGKGVIRMDPVYIQSKNDNNKHTFVACASSSIIGECSGSVKFGQTVDVSEAVVYFATPLLSAVEGSDFNIFDQTKTIGSFISVDDESDILDFLYVDDDATIGAIPSNNGYGTGTVVNVMIYGKVVDAYTFFVYGDVTGDGYVDSFDVVLAGEYVNTFTAPESEAFFNAADVYADSYLDSTDMAYILYFANFEQ